MDPVEQSEPAAETQPAPMADIDPMLYAAEDAALAGAAGAESLPTGEGPADLEAIRWAMLQVAEDEAAASDDVDPDLYDEEDVALDALAEAGGEVVVAPPLARPAADLPPAAALALWLATASMVLPLNAAIQGLAALAALTPRLAAVPAD